MLLGYAIYLGAESDAEDIVAEAFYQLYKRWNGLRDHDSALSYLRSVVSYQVRMRIRHLQVVRRHPPGKIPDAASAESEVVVKEDHQEVVAALRQLPDRQREVLVHRYWLGRTEAEVAADLSISEGSVKTHVSRAMSSLTKALVALR
jgi:RNA polymerase sigma factor (sigma-70 family)